MHCTKKKRQRIALLVAATALLAGPAAPHVEIGAGPTPALTSTGSSVKGAARRWTKIDDFMQEVGDARIYEGVRYRDSTHVRTAIGQLVGQLATIASATAETTARTAYTANDDFFGTGP